MRYVRVSFNRQILIFIISTFLVKLLFNLVLVLLILMCRLHILNLDLNMDQDILARATEYGHHHLVEHYHSISDPDLKQRFYNQLKDLDFKQTNQLYKDVYLHSKNNTGTSTQVSFEPLKNVIVREEIQKTQKQLDQIGYESISKGQVSVCIMSGGQGTRLGFDHPKGMFNIELDSKTTLFQYFSKKLLRLMEIVKRRYPNSHLTQKNMIKWYLMTSDMNHEEIVSFFKQNNYFGYDPESIYFFPQGGIPAVDYNGKIVIQSEGNLSLAPGGNGAMYVEMKNKGALTHMKNHGVKYIYIAPVDNVLLKLADPTCLGFMVKGGFEIVSTYVKKAYPEQKIGVHVLNNGKVNVCEYSQMPKPLTELKNQNNELVYCHGNRATIVITQDFIERITTSNDLIEKINKKYHLAEKKIKYYSPEQKKSIKPENNNGVKFQLFYFDVFEECSKFGLFQTLREQQFAPLKNATGVDSPQSARALLRNLHSRWIQKAGIEVEGEGHIEIDPRLSYSGQDLREIIKQRYQGKVKLPAYIH